MEFYLSMLVKAAFTSLRFCCSEMASSNLHFKDAASSQADISTFRAVTVFTRKPKHSVSQFNLANSFYFFFLKKKKKVTSKTKVTLSLCFQTGACRQQKKYMVN
uniref:Uncharacterized protein n=1 Tax=Anser brachyrhynchus TaxID=132585 RepID=A0A8B9CYD5_9AVES